MAFNSSLFQRPSDRSLFLTAAIAFPLLVLIGYFKSYYFRAFFDVKPFASSLVHIHGIVMTAWVIYFSTQIALIRSKNVKLHISLGLMGIALAILVIVVGFATAFNTHVVRQISAPGIHPNLFFMIAVADMTLFTIFFAGAIYFRKRPAEHKTLMLMTAINFLPAALVRIPIIPPKFAILWAWGVPDLLAIICLIWFSVKHRKFNKVFAAAVVLFIASQPLRMIFGSSEMWHQFVAFISS